MPGIDPKCKELKATLMTTYHTAHTRWIETVSKRFERQLGSALARTQWNDENPGFLLWEGKKRMVFLKVKRLTLVCGVCQMWATTP